MFILSRKFWAILVSCLLSVGVCATLPGIASDPEPQSVTAAITTTPGVPAPTAAVRPTTAQEPAATTASTTKQTPTTVPTTTKAPTRPVTTPPQTTTTQPTTSAFVPIKQPATTVPVTTRAATAATTAIRNDTQFADEIFRLTNIERTNAGLPTLTRAPEALWQAALVRAKETITLFAHTRPDGRSSFSVYEDFGVRWQYVGENLQWATQNTPQFAVQQWMGSAGHRANILGSQFKQLAVGVYQNHCVQLFLT